MKIEFKNFKMSLAHSEETILFNVEYLRLLAIIKHEF